MAVNGLSYHAYDFLTGTYLREIPAYGVSFTRALDGVGNLTGNVNLYDPTIDAPSVVQATKPNRSLIVADWKGIPVWEGVQQPLNWDVDASSTGTTGVLGLNYASTWAYFEQRIQATDYSSPPYSGITGGPLGGERVMPLWPTTPWFGPLIAAQVMLDALSVPFGNPLGGTQVTINGEVPDVNLGLEVAPGDLIPVNYPFTSLTTIQSIVDGLAKLGLGVGFDYALKVVYKEGKPESDLEARFEINWPWRGNIGASITEMTLVDLARARKYKMTEDGSQTAWQVYETGGGGAIYVDSNVAPPEQGFALLERAISRSSINSTEIMGLLKLNSDSDLALYSYAPTSIVVTMGLEDAMVQLGEYDVGEVMRVMIPPEYDPKFPTGYEGQWRLIQYKVDAKDEGDATVELTFAQPPLYLAETTIPKLP